MDLNSFSPLFELAAGLNAAFIAVDKASSFSKIMFDNVLNYKQQTDDKFSVALKGLVDEQTLISLPETICGSSSTGVVIEKLKREREKLRQFVSEKKGELETSAKEAVTLKCHSSMSFANVLFCFLILFLSTTSVGAFLEAIIVSSTMALLLLQAAIWLFGEKRKLGLSSIKIVFYIYLSLVVVCAVLSYLAYQRGLVIPEYLFSICLYVGAVLPFASFLVYAVIIMIRLRPVNTKTDEYLKEAESRKKTIMEEYDAVKTVNNMATRLTRINTKNDE